MCQYWGGWICVGASPFLSVPVAKRMTNFGVNCDAGVDSWYLAFSEKFPFCANICLLFTFCHNAAPLNISREPPVKSTSNFGVNYVPRTLCYTVRFKRVFIGYPQVNLGKHVKVRQKCDIVPGKGSPGISRCLRAGPGLSDAFYRILQILFIFWHFSHGIPMLKGPFVGHFGLFWATFVTRFPCWRVRILPFWPFFGRFRPETPLFRVSCIGPSGPTGGIRERSERALLQMEFASVASELWHSFAHMRYFCALMVEFASVASELCSRWNSRA